MPQRPSGPAACLAHDSRRSRARPRSRRRSRPPALAALLLAAAGAAGAAPGQDAPPDLTQIGIEAVMNLEVTSVSKKPEKLMDATAAVYVITADDIRRSAATSIPELLRTVPGLQVSRINSNEWAIGSRGFTNALSRSLLVLIDGRSVYSPLFAGTYWDTQDTLLEDIERIEVIRGPGATLWGDNAVNGVINIITKSARSTQGVYASAGAGDEERALAGVRTGWESRGGTSFRSYAKYFERDAEFHPSGDAFDGWHMGQAGFRADADPTDRDQVTMQGDAYDGRAGESTVLSTFSPPFVEPVEQTAVLYGGNLLGQWKHRVRDGSDTTLQVYYDHTHRAQPGFNEDRDTVDVEFRHRIRLGSRHDLLWGAGYRLTSGDTESVQTIQFSPEDRTDRLGNAFVQDDIEIVPARVSLTLGSKFEHNDYSGFNYQPNARLLYVPSPRHVLWSAVSRALRVPSRIEQDLADSIFVSNPPPTFFRLQGSNEFDPERLTAYEAGYRVRPVDPLFVDLALFYNDYTNQLSLEPGAPFAEATPPPAHLVVPFFTMNKIGGQSHGAEVVLDWRPLRSWRLVGSYSFLSLSLERSSTSLDPSTVASTEGSSPRHMASLRSSVDLPRSLAVDATFRHASSLPAQQVDAYTEMDLMVRKGLTRHLELAVAGQNLLSPRHAEFAGGTAGAVEIQRSLYGSIAGRW